MEEPAEIQVRESAGLVKNVFDPVANVREPLSEYQTMLDLIHRDPTLSTAFSIIVDFATYRGFDFIMGTRAQRDHWRKVFVDLNFQEVLPNLIYTMCYYGDGFLELRKQDSKTVNELWVLETTEMRIIYDEHGKVLGYVQRPFNMQGLTDEEVLQKEREVIPEEEGGDGEKTQGIFFDPEEVMHFRMKWVGSQVYSYNPNEPIAQVASTRLYAGNYLMNIFINMPPRYIVHLAGIGQRDFNNAKAEFRSSKTNFKKAIAFTKSTNPESKLDLKKVDAPYDEALINIIKWLNNEMAKITRVPRSWLEESAAENRGVTEAEQRPFDVRIGALHKNSLECVINRKLLPMLEKSPKEVDTKKVEESKDPNAKPKKIKDKVQFKFNEISRKGENEIIMTTGLLRDMGLKPEAMVKHLDNRGILGFDPDDFEEKQIAMNMELQPSRERMDKGKQDMTQNRNEGGVSNKSGQKMGIQGKSQTNLK